MCKLSHIKPLNYCSIVAVPSSVSGGPEETVAGSAAGTHLGPLGRYAPTGRDVM